MTQGLNVEDHCDRRDLRAVRSVRTKADLLLIHAPASFDFRERRDIYYPYLSTSGDVPITPLYEYFPVGFKTLQRFLGERDHEVRIVNLATVLLKYPALDLPAFLRTLEVKLFGVDLHWMVHVQGSLAIAQLLKSLHPDVPVVFGGISSTYYADELIRYPFIDMVMRGYDTHEPMAMLLDRLKAGADLRGIPNLMWKSRGVPVDNPFTHTPDSFACGIDWSQLPQQQTSKTLPILEVLSTQNAGCAYNCGWCGGSREAFRRIFKRKRAMARKGLDEIAYEFSTMNSLPDQDRYHFYSIGSYNEPPARLRFFLEQVQASRFKSVSYEQFHLTPDDALAAMARANKRTIITLSPESHDMKIAKLAGRGVYTPEQMERWIERALDAGIFEIDIWYFIGMPEQDEQSVKDNVEYCRRLLRRFKGKRVVPLLCPMIPFLDPASTFFTYPEQHGYRTFYRTVEEHRAGMERASLINRCNYETRWLRRAQLVRVGYEAVRSLVQIKGDIGFLPPSIANNIIRDIDDAMAFMKVVHEVDCIADAKVRARELDAIGDEILARNRKMFNGSTANQSFPVDREIGGRWFDEILHAADFEPVMPGDALAPPAPEPRR